MRPRRRCASGAPARASTSTTGPGGSPCASPCGRCSGSTRTGPRPAGRTSPRLFEQALSFYSPRRPVQMLRGPRTPWPRMQRARPGSTRSIYAEIGRRRATGSPGEDLMSLLLDATDEGGACLSDRHVRDEVMTLLFAGHDTTTSTCRSCSTSSRAIRSGCGALRRRAARGPRRARRPGRASWARRFRCSSRSSTRRCACTRRRGSARAARSSRSRSAACACRAARRSSTARG